MRLTISQRPSAVAEAVSSMAGLRITGRRAGRLDFHFYVAHPSLIWCFMHGQGLALRCRPIGLVFAVPTPDERFDFTRWKNEAILQWIIWNLVILMHLKYSGG